MFATKVGVIVVLAGLCGCTTHTHPNGLRICGVRIPTGAMMPSVWALRSPDTGRRPPAAPARTVLPPSAPTPDYWAARYVRVSEGCDVGATVPVTPVTGAATVVVVRARDGLPAVVGLRLTSAVTVRAWRHGRFAGELALRPG
ncbi:hypothetical protein [Actinoallomurus soli]|uniref:hypothetical protein n=1 Tax=Actinoallomurus soli TaxID=2952535 RepID=UPI002091E7D8|nr:hypothetical protein [Actinoallomurus soli]MCO5969937.1 hypothetical protein [Actinoallomurus soli]